ncbi:ribonuclease T2 [Ruixingdingia sedimenti]|uniref:Ribonuclease T2 n=1 Tax=Ruixingdingia sedimenti TaxID=3073604 RepID=A0ABU1F5P8_9RHOB|nr:ribonuclease T2 [Xinfangfangia sp. LG-4]MDR5652196.1 ribonuclease T2 [Xinfangfangia sp. LG-4]
MRRLALTLAAVVMTAAAAPAWAEDEGAGDFDYYVLSLSWTPGWCAAEGDARGDDRCDAGAGIGWGLHGLWPQYERGWPSWCRTAERDPTRAETAAMGRFMGSPGLAWHQWKKHGRCSGLSARDYFLASARAMGKVKLPDLFDRLDRTVRLPAAVVEEAFLEANPGLSRDMITVTCAGGAIHEVRVCLTPDLDPRRCGRDVIRDCTLKDAVMQAPR